MQKKNVDDYLTEGMYGTRRPLEAERKQYLGTLRERIVIALTIGQVMTDAGLKQLEEAMKQHKKQTQLLFNGQISYRYLTSEKALAATYNIPYTVITQTDQDTNIGAVLTYDYAINKENIFISDQTDNDQDKDDKPAVRPFLSRFRNWFRS